MRAPPGQGGALTWWYRTVARGRRAPGGSSGSVLDLVADERLDGGVRVVVGILHRRRLHEVARRRKDRTGQLAVHGDLAGAQRVDDDARRVRRVVHLELELGVQRYVAERAPLHADVRPLAVVEPRDVVGRADVHIALRHLVRDLRGDRLGLRDLLGDQAVALQHVHEVHVAAEVELVGAQQLDATVFEELRQRTMHDRGTDL